VHRQKEAADRQTEAAEQVAAASAEVAALKTQLAEMQRRSEAAERRADALEAASMPEVVVVADDDEEAGGAGAASNSSSAELTMDDKDAGGAGSSSGGGGGGGSGSMFGAGCGAASALALMSQRDDARLEVKLERVTVQLTDAQRAAVDHVARTKLQAINDHKMLLAKCQELRPGVTQVKLRQMLEMLGQRAEMRLLVPLSADVGGRPLVEHLIESERLKNLFETGRSGGSNKKGERKRWEARLFGSSYDDLGAGDDGARERPKYGYLNVLTHKDGIVDTQYGRSYLVLANNVRGRCTITSADSMNSDAEVGTLSQMAHVLLDIIKNCKKQPAKLIDVLERAACRPSDAFSEVDRALMEDYAELQFHGDIYLKRDVESMVVHPSDMKWDGDEEKMKQLYRAFSQAFNIKVMLSVGHTVVVL
jgi:hypothetical protein